LLKEIVIAFQSWSEAHRFIQQHKFWKWIVIPGIIYAVLFIAGMYFFWPAADDAISWVSEKLSIETWLQRKRSEWLSFFFVMMGMMLGLTFVFPLLLHIYGGTPDGTAKSRSSSWSSSLYLRSRVLRGTPLANPL